MKNLNFTYLLIISLTSLVTSAQSSNVSVMAGYKAFEVSASYLDHETELSFGLAITAVSSDLVEKRANRNDVNKNVHEFNTKITPAAFGLIGGQFDELTIVGKLGAAYVDQDINKERTKDLFFAVGVIFDYKIRDNLAVRASYDNVAGPMAGITFHFNN